ncbi:TetR/AcrR family transcriptional regulator [Haloechinothrix sp. LS1_15]|uniref:TetR/AcrR family transcriptional regulator n=1 Tax=Haloechinothrix sp. LS1_15 TaxID=2652248 RepID=UPI00294597D4|nr:TetR/AcrR family transcriptional regulator [Haloechinothrix sp. LS1_15]MDV6011712.1 TetR/AcrR family transcriptional regulator [Haloechinothrix sp. LS1_15]
MTGTRTTAGKPGKRGNRKAQLAAVAAELFRARGYHEVGVTDIAAAAGVTGPAIYRHFSDKQDMLGHIVLCGLDELVEATDEVLATGGTPSPERVDALLATLARLAVERRELTALWRTQRRHLRQEDHAALRERATLLYRTWTQTLRTLRPELADSEAELLCFAAMSVFGSASVHATRIAKGRFQSLLAERARAVLHCELPPVDAGTLTGAATGLDAEPQVLRASRREQLITEAGRLFQERGFHEVNMDEIGAAAGISGPSVYRHFPSKAALFMAVSQRVADRLEHGRQQVSHTAADEADALRGLAASYVDTMVNHADLLAVGQQMSALSEAERAELRRIQRDYVGEWVRLLGTVRPERDTSANRVVVHAALTIANDLLRARRVTARPWVRAELVTLMATALGLPDPASPTYAAGNRTDNFSSPERST